MNALKFGTLLHDALERYHLEVKDGRTFDESSLKAFFEKTLQEKASKGFADLENPILDLQLKMILQRINSAIPWFMERRAAGWEVMSVEYEYKEAIPVGDTSIMVKGRMDLVERHPELGIQLIDFKTYEKVPKSVAEKVFFKSAKTLNLDDYFGWQILDHGKKQHAWGDLQLALYTDYLKRKNPGVSVSCGYLVFPQR